MYVVAAGVVNGNAGGRVLESDESGQESQVRDSLGISKLCHASQTLYLGPLQIHGIHQRSLKVFDSCVLSL